MAVLRYQKSPQWSGQVLLCRREAGSLPTGARIYGNLAQGFTGIRVALEFKDPSRLLEIDNQVGATKGIRHLGQYLGGREKKTADLPVTSW